MASRWFHNIIFHRRGSRAGSPALQTTSTTKTQSKRPQTTSAGKRAELAQVGTVVRPAMTKESFGGYIKELDEGFDVRIDAEYWSSLPQPYVISFFQALFQLHLPDPSSCNGLLVRGPPGCGKTSFVHVLAGELGVTLLQVVLK